MENTNSEEIINLLKTHKIPKKYSESILRGINHFSLRKQIVGLQGFALLTHEWIDEFVKWIGDRKCLEIMAGCGSLSKVLKDKNIDIIATDNYSWGSEAYNWNKNKNYWTDIENLDCIKAIEKYKDRDIVIMSWAYMDENAYKCLLKMREVKPNMVMVVIGEGEGGCTADDDFFNEYKEIRSKDLDYINLLYQRWDGLYDHIMVVK